MTQPTLNVVPNYDATKDYTYTFTYLGAELTTTNTLSIREDRENSTPVYEKDQESLDKNHILPGGTLRNGTAYLAKLRVKTPTDYSDWSPEIRFTCYTTPKIMFDTIDQKQFIYTNDVQMSALYLQEQGEPVEKYQFTLYDQRHVALERYPLRVPSANSPTRFSERVSNIQKGKLYYIGLKVITTHGLIYEQLQEFTAQYITPSVSGVVHPRLNQEDGQIDVEFFLKQMLGTSAKAFIPNRSSDNDDYYTYWKDDYVVVPKDNPLMFTKLAMAKASDWVAKIWCMNVQNGVFLDFAPEFGRGQHIKFTKYDDYITCEKRFGNVVYRTKSNVINGLALRPFYLYIKVVEYRIEMWVEVDKTFVGDDKGNAGKGQEELDAAAQVTAETQRAINLANTKISVAYQFLQDTHNNHWQQYITQVNAAIADARARNINHDELVARVMEIDDAYWDYFNHDEMVNYFLKLKSARRDAEGTLSANRPEYMLRVEGLIRQIQSGALSLDEGLTKIEEYSDLYRLILDDIPVFDKYDLDEIKRTYNAYADQCGYERKV